MSPNHYESLGVAPWAEDAAIRAAYRSLMRLYHPDRNENPQAQSRVREITAAYAVLRDPEKRAAYDALHLALFTAGTGEAIDRRSRPPMRNLGLASIGLALALSLALVWPRAELPPGPQTPPTVTAKPRTRHIAGPAPLPAPPNPVAAHPPPKVEIADLPLAQAHPATPRQPTDLPAPLPRREIVQAAVPKSPPQVPRIAERSPSSTPATPAPAGCPGNDGCADDRQAQVERMATGYLKQSMEHADWYKQQLLLSARNRSATSRALCHSDDCVTNAYLRQIRDTRSIMEGHIPSQ